MGMTKEEVIVNVVRNLIDELRSGDIDNLDELEANYLESGDEYCVNYGDELLVDGLTEKEAEEIRDDIIGRVYTEVFDIEAIDFEVYHKGVETWTFNGKPFHKDVWEVTLGYCDAEMKFEFSQGSGWGGATPEIRHVLHALISDYWGYKDSLNFEDYCDHYGTDYSDGLARESAREVYDLVAKQAGELEKVFTNTEIERITNLVQDI